MAEDWYRGLPHARRTLAAGVCVRVPRVDRRTKCITLAETTPLPPLQGVCCAGFGDRTHQLGRRTTRQNDGHRHPLRCQQRTVQPSSIALGSLVVDPGWTRCGPVPAPTLARNARKPRAASWVRNWRQVSGSTSGEPATHPPEAESAEDQRDRKSTRLNSSHLGISYAVF